MNELGIKHDIVEVGKRMYNREFVASNDGNLSVRISPNEIIITPTGISKGYMSVGDMLKVDMNGNVLSGSKKPSSEIKMHLAVYKNRPDISAVCHAHPQKATAFAVARQVCKDIALPEVIFSLGNVALSDYAAPSTDELPKSIEKIIKTTDAVLLSNHGALTIGEDIFDAYYKMETLEHFAGIILYARQLGGEKNLSQEQIEQLYRIRSDVFGKQDLGSSSDGYCGGVAANKYSERSKSSAASNTSEKRISQEDIINEIVKNVMSRINNDM